MRLTTTEQFTIGVYLSAATAVAIISRSLDFPLSLVVMGAIWTVVMFAVRGFRSSNRPLRILSRLYLVVVAAWSLVMFAAVVERVYVVNGESYPHWLATAELGHVDMATLKKLRETECVHDPIEVLQKRDFVVLRCGFAITQPSTKTYIATSYKF